MDLDNVNARGLRQMNIRLGLLQACKARAWDCGNSVSCSKLPPFGSSISMSLD